MSITGRIAAVQWRAASFARHHSLTIPPDGVDFTIAPAFAHGGFGAVHALEALDGRPPARGIVVKVFEPAVVARHGGPAALIAGMEALAVALDACGDPAWPDAVLAMPFFMATVELAGDRVFAAFMLDLRALGYAPVDFANPATAGLYFARTQRDRIELALRFTRRCVLLERARFVHGDLNPENLLVNLATLDVQIIDFDAGVVVRTGSERPLTPGKLDDCMPPEVKSTVAGADPVDLDKCTPAAERWAVGSLVGYLVFGAHPAFFLRAISAAVIDAYARQPGSWPEIDERGPLFTTLARNQAAYERMKPELAALPGGARDAFKALFAAGTDGQGRPTAAEWATGLEGLRAPPVIDVLEVDADFVVEGTLVRVSWQARNAAKVHLSSIGDVAAAGSIAQPLTSTTAFTLRAENAYGTAEAHSPAVRVIALPRIDAIPVPAFPGVTLNFDYPSDLLGASMFNAGVIDSEPLRADPMPAPRLACCFTVEDLAVRDAYSALPHARGLPPAPRIEDAFSGLGSLWPALVGPPRRPSGGKT